MKLQIISNRFYLSSLFNFTLFFGVFKWSLIQLICNIYEKNVKKINKYDIKFQNFTKKPLFNFKFNKGSNILGGVC